MHIPDEPPIGNLVAYEYLWLSQENTREDGAKVYPVALIFAKKIIASVTLAYAVGMSHKPPDASEKAIEVPKKLKRHLGLDEDPSWIYTDQLFAIDRRRHVPHGKTDMLNDLSARSDASALTTLLCLASGIFVICCCCI